MALFSILTRSVGEAICDTQTWPRWEKMSKNADYP